MQETQPSARVKATDLTTLSAGELARLIAVGEFSAFEVVEAHIRRIEAVNPRLNAVVVPLFKQAREDAKKADAARERGDKLGPLHGVPITIKECFDIVGTASTAGISNRAAHRATEDDPLVARLREAGAIILGKTNVPQLLLYNETDNPVYGRTNNPWNLERASGGSSGGEGAIIAAGGSPLGLGNDIGGSLRTPAQACGISSLKPTAGRLTINGSIGDLIFAGQEGILSQAGPMARSVADLTLAMQVLAAPGLEAYNPAIPPVPLGDPSQVRLDGLRVAMYIDDGFFPAAPALRRIVKEAATALRQRGVQVEEFQPSGVKEAMRLVFGIIGADGGTSIKQVLGNSKRDRRISGLLQIASLPSRLRPTLVKAAERSGQPRLAFTIGSIRNHSANSYFKLIEDRNQYRLRFMAALDKGRYDAIICPPHALPALTHGSSYYLSSAASYAMLFNLLGLPAGVVAAGRVRADEESDRARTRDVIDRTARNVEKNSVGLPVGVQVAARLWREDVALAVMAALEEHFKAQPDYPARPAL